MNTALNMERKLLCLLLAGIGSVWSLAAQADTKAGVDAWTRGDFASAVRQWQGDAARGDADAQFNLGQAYKLGKGVPQDLTKAEELFGKAAAQGHLQASDNYGLLLFQRGARAQGMPFIRAAAGRGDPRAQYLLGLAHFNGDLMPKDWVRAYALVSLAQQAGLEQAKVALAQMDQYVPVEQRQQAVVLSAELASQAEATRARQLAAVDLGASVPSGAIGTASPTPPVDTMPSTRAPTMTSAEDAAAAASSAARNDGPWNAGADYARPATPQPRPVAVHRSATPPAASLPPRSTQPATTATPASTGAWKVQLGAFGVAANADALWNRVRSRPELAGHPRINARSGAVTRLLAGGFASREAAQAACSRLSAAGFTCVVAR